jgi:sugar lactone lactonase YvrE
MLMTSGFGRRACTGAVLLGTVLMTACGGGGGSSVTGGGGTGTGTGGTDTGTGGGGTGTGSSSYTVGGTVAGLSGSGLVVQNNGADDLQVSSAGSFTFATSVASGAKYGVTVKTQPANPSQTCAVSNGGGTIGSNNVTNVALTCTINAFSVGGTVTGLTGSGLVLQDNGGDDLAVSSSGSFVFATSVASGVSYNVTVKTQPSGPVQACTATNDSGTVGSVGVASITVNCGPLALVAGGLGGQGSIDGKGTAARFSSPSGVASDAAGNVYVADQGNRTIRKITADGVVSTLVGAAGQAGSADGSGSVARFKAPAAVAIDSAGNLYVADPVDSTIRKITPVGVVSTLAGVAGQSGSTDDIGNSTGAGRFNEPYGVAVDSTGNVYVADFGNSAIRKITPTGSVSTYAGTAGNIGSANGVGPAAAFYLPQGIATDSAGNVYVADTYNFAVRKITPDRTVTTLAGTTHFSYPFGVAVDAAGNVYVGCEDGTILEISTVGAVTTLAGTINALGSADGVGAAAQFSGTTGLATGSAGNVYVADVNNAEIRKITSTAVVSTLAGLAPQPGSTDGTGRIARFNYPQGIAADAAGNMYVADNINSTIRKITAAGVVSTLAGVARKPGTSDSIPGPAQFATPRGMAVDSTGNVYVADSGNVTIRKITSAGQVTTLAGTPGTTGSSNGTSATTATFGNPTGIAVDSAGNVYVADTGNNMVRKVSGGQVTLLAGSTTGQPGSANGNGGSAGFKLPTAVATDSAGNVYVADSGNATIRKISPPGDVSTLAGTAGVLGSADGTGAAAQFGFPTAVVVDPAGNVYVADSDNDNIRKITPTGVVTTVVGAAGQAGVHIGTLPGTLNRPMGLALLPGPVTTLVETDSENAVLQITLP